MIAARVAAGVGALLLGLIVIFQIALVAGAPWGSATQGGAVDGSLAPVGRLLAAVSAAICLAFALGLLGRVELGPLVRHPRWASVISWGCLIYSVLGTIMNAASPSSIERAIWTPVCLVLAGCAAVVLGGTQRRRPKAK